MAATVVVASAGSGKTTYLVDQVEQHPNARILITTYTIENLDNIRDCVIERFGCIPPNVEIETWFSTLLRHGVRPYQNLVASVGIASGVAFVRVPEALRYSPKTDVDRYYFTSGGGIYKDRVSDFICLVDQQSDGLVIDRLRGIYSHILIDELQDMSGPDLDFIERLFKSDIEVLGVADPRQGTYTTTDAAKHKGFRRAGIVDWLKKKERAGLVKLEDRTECWRCNQAICDFADDLYPHLPRTTSRNEVVTGHDGIFYIREAEVPAYFAERAPVVLRWNRASDTLGLPAMNFGIVKGRTYERVLIFPTKPMKKYLANPGPDIKVDRARFYVAVTRARFSVAFVI